MKLKHLGICSLVTLSLFTSCKKTTTQTTDITSLKKEIISHAAHQVCKASYEEMYAHATLLEQSINQFTISPTQANLDACRTNWRTVRNTWETTEAWLFGPISANNIDPRIDTWPVDFNAIDSVLATSNVFTESYVNSLDDALKGFHPIEYFLWGTNGNKLPSDFTPRQMEYLTALTQNLSLLAKEVRDTWTNGYALDLTNAGNGSTSYSTQQAAFVELIDAMAGICDEVANGKINDPFTAQDPSLEESPFAQNSLTDFKNNIQGVMKMYQGSFGIDGNGIEDFVKEYNLSVDQEFKAAHVAAMTSLESISVPFGQAILTQPVLVQQAMDKINALEEVIDQKIKPIILQYIQ